MSTEHPIKIFVSHHNGIARKLGKLKKSLEEKGIDLFLSHDDIGNGEVWSERIKEEIRERDYFLFVGNDDSYKSPACNQEIGFAFALNKRILHFCLDNKLEIPFFLKDRQAKFVETIPELKDKILPCIAWDPAEIDSPKRMMQRRQDALNKLRINGFRVGDGENKDRRLVLRKEPYDDYSYETKFTLSGQIRESFFGQKIKIICKKSNTSRHTVEWLPKKFDHLNSNYVSRFIYKEGTYRKLWVALSILLRNIEFDSHFGNEFSESDAFRKSILREDERDHDFKSKVLKELCSKYKKPNIVEGEIKFDGPFD